MKQHASKNTRSFHLAKTATNIRSAQCHVLHISTGALMTEIPDTSSPDMMTYLPPYFGVSMQKLQTLVHWMCQCKGQGQKVVLVLSEANLVGQRMTQWRQYETDNPVHRIALGTHPLPCYTHAMLVAMGQPVLMTLLAQLLLPQGYVVSQVGVHGELSGSLHALAQSILPMLTAPELIPIVSQHELTPTVYDSDTLGYQENEYLAMYLAQTLQAQAVMLVSSGQDIHTLEMDTSTEGSTTKPLDYGHASKATDTTALNKVSVCRVGVLDLPQLARYCAS